jgi:hypothetical protein
VTGEGPYTFPIALEVARADLKTSSHAGHRTPWQLLADFAATGDCADLALWHEWEHASEHVQAIRWSNGLRAKAGLGAECTDEEVVQAIVGGEVVYTFAMAEWRLLCRTRGARAEVLRAAEEGGELSVRGFLRELAKQNVHNISSTGAA